MSIISRQETRGKRQVAVLSAFLAVVAAFLTACGDFHGPWEYTPEERDVYTGIYTYGYVLAGGSAEVCFSKVYELEESSAENFAFYDSAKVTVKGLFVNWSTEVDTTLELFSKSSRPNCFSSGKYFGVSGESYTLKAYFEWDSSGSAAKSTYKAVATIPNPVKVKGLNIPKQDGSYEWESNPSYKNPAYLPSPFRINFLEYPMDMEFIKCAMDYDKTVRGVLSIMNYDLENGESVNTTINHMLSGVTEEDSAGYRGIFMHKSLERTENLGFSINRWVAGFNELDTLFLMNMMLPLGNISVDFYATDDAYIDYIRKVKESVSDSRILPESNIENGMGVFSGMAKTSLYLEVLGDGVDMAHVAFSNCDNKGENDDESWETRACRLYQDVACSGMPDWDYNDYGLLEANARAYEYYRDSVHNRNVKTCYPSNVKAAMMLDTTKWSLFLPDSISAEEKSAAYGDGLKRYCVASNFRSNSIADCSDMEKQCLETPEKNDCKEYLWNWCADRNWNLDYGQCLSGLVSRYYLEEQKSSILEKVVKKICDRYQLPICKD